MPSVSVYVLDLLLQISDSISLFYFTDHINNLSCMDMSSVSWQWPWDTIYIYKTCFLLIRDVYIFHGFK